MHLRPRLNSLEKNIVCIIYPGYQKRGLPVFNKKFRNKPIKLFDPFEELF